MHSTTRILLAAVLLVTLMAACKQTPSPPVAPKDPYVHVIHGDSRVDPYYWMNQRDNQQVLEYLKAENEYTQAIMSSTEGLQKNLLQEMRERIVEDDLTVPILDNGYYYYVRYEEGKEFPIYCRREGSMEADEEVYLNVNDLAEGYSYYSAVGVNVSPNNQIVAFGVDTVSRRQYTIHFKNLQTGRILDTSIPQTTGGIAWANNSETVFYTRRDETLRPWQVLRYNLNSPNHINQDLVYQEDDPTFSTFVYTERSKSYIMIGSSSTLSSEFHFIDANSPYGDTRVIQPRVRGLEYSPSHYDGNFYITTNHNAKNFRLMVTPVDNPRKESWQEIIPHRDDILLNYAEVFSNFLVISERSKGITQLRIKSWDNDVDHYLDFGEEIYSAWLRHNPEFDTDVIQYSYSSLTTPMSVFKYNMATQSKELIKQTEIKGNFNPDNYTTKRVWATSPDSTPIPISLVFRKGLNMDADNPTLLYAYGSYGSATNAFFDHQRLSLLDRGFIFAIAHVRGGDEMGRYWYEDGRQMKKMNTFTDFIACSEHLIEEGYTTPNKLFAMGGSAGGLLMGVIANMRPDLYKGIIAMVPFVDVVTTMLDTTIPLTTSEYDEWGNPNDPEYYQYIKSYSPYDQIKEQDYPNMLITAGYHDSQVQFFEPAKWTARLRETKTDSNLLLLKVDMDTGHSGASGRFKALEETAFVYAFIFKLLGIDY